MTDGTVRNISTRIRDVQLLFRGRKANQETLAQIDAELRRRLDEHARVEGLDDSPSGREAVAQVAATGVATPPEPFTVQHERFSWLSDEDIADLVVAADRRMTEHGFHNALDTCALAEEQRRRGTVLSWVMRYAHGAGTISVTLAGTISVATVAGTLS